MTDYPGVVLHFARVGLGLLEIVGVAAPFCGGCGGDGGESTTWRPLRRDHLQSRARARVRAKGYARRPSAPARGWPDLRRGPHAGVERHPYRARPGHTNALVHPGELQGALPALRHGHRRERRAARERREGAVCWSLAWLAAAGTNGRHRRFADPMAKTRRLLAPGLWAELRHVADPAPPAGAGGVESGACVAAGALCMTPSTVLPI